jgi:hypothetical protein
VNQLLELYSRCLKAVEGHGPEQNQAGGEPGKSVKASEQTMRAPQGWTAPL